jgi:hypothetical protein
MNVSLLAKTHCPKALSSSYLNGAMSKVEGRHNMAFFPFKLNKLSTLLMPDLVTLMLWARA